MDYQKCVDTIESVGCVLSVEKTETGDIGDIRVIAANKGYIEQFETKYYPGIIYSELVQKERKFEYFVSTVAFEHRLMHTYVDGKGIGYWMDQFYVPLESDREDIGYCLFTYEMTKNPDPDRMGDVSIDTASSVIKSCAVFRTAKSFQDAIDSVVKELLEKCGAKSCVVLSVDEFNKKVTYIGGHSTRRSQDEVKAVIARIPFSVVETWKRMTYKTNCLIIANESDMETLSRKNPEWADSLKRDGVHSLCFIPLYQNNEVIGYLYVAEFDTSRVTEVKELIELTSFFLAAEIANHNLLLDLEHMSKIDMLTGVKNRNAMNNRVDEFVMNSALTDTPYGVAFVDLNGLKKMNDENGHEAGDHMLWQAATMLSSVFDGFEVYRAGGDEFSVICADCKEDIFSRLIDEIREKTAYPAQITAAVGKYYASHGEDIRFAMHEADQEMYKIKQKFYEDHPELKVRKDDKN